MAIPSFLVDELKRHRLASAEELLGLNAKIRPGSSVVMQEDGRLLQPNSLTHEFVRIPVKAPGLPKIRFHNIRHSHATHLLAAGDRPKVAQEVSGIRRSASRLISTAT